MSGRSSWQDGDLVMRHPRDTELDVAISSREFSLIQRLRQLETGMYIMAITKSKRGKEGLQSFRVVPENNLTENK